MGYETIKYERRGKIGIITINRTEKLNALNGKVIEELVGTFRAVKSDEGIRAVILTGAGEKAFVAGADIPEIENIGLREGLEFCRRGQEMNRFLEELGKPSIAAVNGLALGAGLELALSCTFRILSETSKVGLPEVGLGVIPGYGGTQRLARLIGKTQALWLILTGQMISADEALRMGIANMVVRGDKVMEAALDLANKIVDKAPLAVKMAMTAVNRGSEIDLESATVLEAVLANVLLGTKDKDEGIRAFIEKRKPVFSGE